uniref:Uncharacterized protein n=1 Tax=Arundo donax TaxID=35708 RepID=A0A0A9B277_ARUDO
MCLGTAAQVYCAVIVLLGL